MCCVIICHYQATRSCFTVLTMTKLITTLRSHQNFYEIFTHKQFFPTSAGNVQAQLHFQDDQQRVFGISNISNCIAMYINTNSMWLQKCDDLIKIKKKTQIWISQKLCTRRHCHLQHRHLHHPCLARFNWLKFPPTNSISVKLSSVFSWGFTFKMKPNWS